MADKILVVLFYVRACMKGVKVIQQQLTISSTKADDIIRNI